MTLSDFEIEIIEQYETQTPFEVMRTSNLPFDINPEEYIVLSILLKKHDRTELLDDCLDFLTEIRNRFEHKEYYDNVNVCINMMTYTAIYAVVEEGKNDPDEYYPPVSEIVDEEMELKEVPKSVEKYITYLIYLIHK